MLSLGFHEKSECLVLCAAFLFLAPPFVRYVPKVSLKLHVLIPLTINIDRGAYTSLLLATGTLLVMGGDIGSNMLGQDVWKSSDMGASWTLVTARAGWKGKSSPFT